MENQLIKGVDVLNVEYGMNLLTVEFKLALIWS